MAHFVYFISDFTRKNIHIGYCTDILKMLELYNRMNEVQLHYPPENYLNRLVYFEEASSEFWAKDRFNILSTLTKKEKGEMISEVNPDWMDLTKALNFSESI